MQPNEGYQYDSGPPNNGGQGHQIPAGSRLNQYLANNNRQAMLTGPSFGPGTPINVNAPVFIPKHQQPQPPPPPPPAQMVNQFAQLSIHDVPVQMIPFGQINAGPPPYGPVPHMNHRPPPHHQPPPSLQPPPPHLQQAAYDRYQQENRGGTTYFYQEPTDGPPDEEHYHDADVGDGCMMVVTSGSFGYNAPLPMTHMARFRGKANANQQTQFISPELRMELLNRQLAFDTKPDPSMYQDVPQAVEHFSSLVPLENTSLQNQSQTTYKAFSCRDGIYYCLRRIHGNRIQHPGKQTHLVEQWKKLVHGNVVPLREVLINCRAFDDSSLVFAYDYYPLAETLMTKHFDSKCGTNFYDPANGFRINSPMSANLQLSGSGANETLIWSYIIQIAAALRAIHASGLACRALDLNKIIVYGNKIMISFCGIQDVLDPDSTPIQQQQNEDLNMFGNVVVALATGRANAWRKDLYQNSKKIIEDNFSIDLRNVIGFLHNNGSRRTINEIMPMIGGRFFTVMENMQAKSDVLEGELSREMENGRLFRLLSKMNTVLERVENGVDDGWSETGDRFMLKLFRDYVFHQVTDQGKPWLDLAHIIQCLNKLDCGSPEKIEMVSRNGDTQIIVDYSTLKRCLDKSFRELIGTNIILHR
ncbi:hypothetical protein CRE_25543 [Caenorhabditis remanei]|uniref:PAN2-PAN3 deadenylation complex subunit PAN3 n=2 Tax=Caenorhabditis remanei TaxID=31234 RepID=E3LS61_CAERE|nr:hypothetical protein CRE_25543 [Caenorhabditis remanei]